MARERLVREREGRPTPRGPFDNPWTWLAALGVAALVIVLIVLALARDDDAERERGTVEETVTETVEQDETVEGGQTPVVPDVVGANYVEAAAEIEALGLIADTFPVDSEEARGTVVSQDPAAGTELARREHVELGVAVGPGERETLRVPDVTGPEAEDARIRARDLGFTTRTVDRDAPTAEEVGEVILQEPAADTPAPALTQITLYVGR